jgi:hypothetical protein
MEEDWEKIFARLKPKLGPAGVSLCDKDIRVIAVMVQHWEAESARKMEAYEKALKLIRDTPSQRKPDQEPCETCWDLKAKARQVLSKWE